ncbi:Methyl-accepting chemotaxis protein [Hyella patelloides LEGE 07179]|uniref:Methyl-accepting chemotaxis protein n=1 Tax=Hyella patelloides LEGE 07179 TaxID=945734 RepID=A0A563W2X1_9CYAN|nr:GAF domain-containing protein [Hyella patelloides]VEP18000.1 Methyl-accepting chemotaxis protein [Hyella patelloides LEGE 07179]
MTQNSNQQSNSSFKNRFYQGDTKVVLSPDIVNNNQGKSASFPDVSPLLSSTAQPPSATQNWWRNLSFKNQIALITVTLSFASASVVGGASHILPNHFSSLVLGSSFAGLIAGIVTLVFTRKFTNAIADANSTINKLGNGQLNNWGDKQLDELELLGTNLNQLSGQLQVLANEQGKINQQRQLISSIAFRTRQTANMDVLMQTAVDGARDVLDTDRVVVYRFNDDWTGTMIAESVADGFPQVLNETIGDPCFRDRHVAQYQAGRIRAISDIYTEPGLTDCHIRMLDQYKVRANLVVPIRQKDKLMGLLIAHHCRDARAWQKVDVDVLNQIATEIEYGVDYINFVEEQKKTAKRAWFFGDIAFRASQTMDLEEVFNTTVRGAREILQTDRVMVYQFNHDWSGTMVAESVDKQYPSVLEETIDDPCFRGRYVDLYKSGRVKAINNIRTEPGLTECHIRTLEQYDVKANLVAPIRKDGELMGLLIAHHCSMPRIWQEAEIDFFAQLATQVEYAVDRLSYIDKIQATVGKARLFGDLAFRARQSLKKEDIFNITVQGARKALETDRVLFYKFNHDWSGTMIAESVGEGWVKVLDIRIEDPCFKGRYVDLYRNGRVKAINDIYNEPGMTDCHMRTLEQYDVKANLVVPIRKDDELYGLLIAHHCAAPRAWQKSEMNFFSELATQTEYALDHVSFIEQLEQAKQKAETASLEQRQQTEAIQHQLDTLVKDIQDAFTGNLTVRAQATDGEIGIVAEFLNTTLDNLQRVVMQVQSTSGAVIETVHGSEDNINNLSNDASRQAEAITVALGHIQGITESIHGVADNAQSAKKMVQQANQTLEDGDRTMNRTVDGILTIKETVEETAQKVKRLGEASQKISRVVNLIRDLANQTHVLALNASIEANGTSGEGQGFAVVAEEVRSLSEQSTAATKEIEQILEEIQTETNQVATAMEVGREQVIAGTDLVETTRQQLTSIAKVSGQIKQLVEEMAQSATAQAKTSASVFQTMQEVETIAQHTSAKSVASAKSFNKLLEVAEELKDSVTQFKVN